MPHPTFQPLRQTALDLFLHGVRAADPNSAVDRALRAQPLHILPGGGVVIIAIGKGAGAMMKAALAHVPAGALGRAIVVTNYENHAPIAECECYPAGHPVPDQGGQIAGVAVQDALRAATKNDHVLCLISGGGSALLPTPVAGVSLADKIALNEILLAGGSDILQTNLVRQQLSVLKGGGMARLAAPASVRALILSDVIGDTISAIASGPTAPPLGSASEAIALLRDKNLWNLVPDAIKTALRRGAPCPETPAADNLIVGSNARSLAAVAAAAAAKGWAPVIVSQRLVGDVGDAAIQVMDDIVSPRYQNHRALIWGGETTVTLRGTGAGGRNQELALRVASAAADIPGEWVFLSGGTDGRDGPTTAAGGLVDGATMSKIAASGHDARQLLANNDSNRALGLAGDLLETGATGTNVADIQLFLRARA